MQRCAVDGTVVLTVATSPQYLDSCAELAHTVRMHTPFECLFVALPARLHNAYPSILVFAPLPSWAQQHPVEPVFCERRMSGWRQTHILKTQALLMLLQQGQNVLLLGRCGSAAAGQSLASFCFFKGRRRGDARRSIPEFWLDVHALNRAHPQAHGACRQSQSRCLGSGHFGRGVECRQLDRLLLRKSMDKAVRENRGSDAQAEQGCHDRIAGTRYAGRWLRRFSR